MARVRIEIHEDGLRDLVSQNKYIRDELIRVGKNVKAAAEASAQDAQNGPGGRLEGYAEAGFDVIWDSRGKRPRVNIVSLADPAMALRVHFYTQKRDGVSHLRKALRDGAGS